MKMTMTYKKSVRIIQYARLTSARLISSQQYGSQFISTDCAAIGRSHGELSRAL